MFNILSSSTFDLMRYLPALGTLLFLMLALLGFTPEDLRKKILKQNGDGYAMALACIVPLAFSFIFHDYTTALVLFGVAVGVFLLGALIAADDENVTDHLITWKMAKVYAVIAGVFYLWGAVNGWVAAGGFNPAIVGHYFLRLTLPTIAAASAVTIGLLSLASRRFRDDVMPFDTQGKSMAVLGGLTLVFTLFTGSNPSLVIVIATVGGMFFSMGYTISVADKWTTLLLKWPMTLLMSGVAAVALIISRGAF